MPVGLIVDSKRARQFTVSVDLLLQRRDLLFCCSNGVSAGKEATGKFVLALQLDQRLSELGRVTPLLAVLGRPELLLLCPALTVVLNGQ